MLIDARTIAAGTTLEADVCVVGGGPAGITLALELAEQGVGVCLLESGGEYYEPGAQELARGEIVGAPYFPLESCRLRFLGGTTNHWNGACWPLEAVDFEARPGVPHSGWPFPAAELDGPYRRAQVWCQLGPFAYEGEDWTRPDADPPLALDPERVRTRVIQSSPPTRFGIAYRERLERATGVRVLLHAHALEVLTDRDATRAEGVRVGCLGGAGLRVRARRTVLAAGGLENPRLLLVSRERRPAGLGNDRDRVGRYFMDHLMLPCGILLPSSDYLSLGFYRKRTVEETVVRGVLTLAPEVVRREGLLGFSANVYPRSFAGFFSEADEAAHPGIPALSRLAAAARGGPAPEDLSGDVAAVAGDLDRIAARVAEGLWHRGRVGADRIYLRCQSEQVPNPDSRLRLAEERDAFGQPRARLDWRLSELDHRSLRRAVEVVADEFGRAGLGRGRVLLEEDDGVWAEWTPERIWNGPRGSYHPMGTTRMDDDPGLGVVDRNARVHGVAGLYVTGSSVFPTSGYANPTLTLVALAVRLADHLAAGLS